MPNFGVNALNTMHQILLIDEFPLRRSAYSNLFESSSSTNVFVTHRDDDNADGISAVKGDMLTLVVLGGLLISSTAGRAKLETVMREVADPVVAVVDSHTPECVACAIEMQLKGILPTSEEPSVVFAALDFIAAGGSYIPHVSKVAGGKLDMSLLRRGVDPIVTEENNSISRQEAVAAEPELTPRQNDVLNGLVNGESNKVIAGTLGISEATVKSHIRQVMLKLHARNRTHAALLARNLRHFKC